MKKSRQVGLWGLVWIVLGGVVGLGGESTNGLIQISTGAILIGVSFILENQESSQ